MLLRDQLVEEGRYLFRWRSYLPLGLLPVAFLAFPDAVKFERCVGERSAELAQLVGFTLSILGLAVRVVTVGFAAAGTSGRNTRDQRAESLNTTGLYSVTRNPLYVGNFLMLLGFVVAIEVWWLIIIATAAFALYYERIILAEEAFLEEKFGMTYVQWAGQTPPFIPRLQLWRSPDRPFSVASVLSREAHGLYLILVFFSLIDLGQDILVEGDTLRNWIHQDWPWIVLFWISTAVFVALVGFSKIQKRVAGLFQGKVRAP
jgi:protein-S-isoprenylcysteine O-methyltransferase Ste14